MRLRTRTYQITIEEYQTFTTCSVFRVIPSELLAEGTFKTAAEARAWGEQKAEQLGVKP